MRSLMIMLLAAVTAIQGFSLFELALDEWEVFKVKYGKTYSPEEEMLRLDIFLDNVERINKHNEEYARGLHTFTLRINRFADMTGALEGQHFRKTGKLISLSEQNLIDCSGEYGNNGCEGGLMDNSFTYVKENHGIDTEESYPYEAQNDTCRFNLEHVGATDVGFVDLKSGSEADLQAAVATVGPISVGVDARSLSFTSYDGGVYYTTFCSSAIQYLDHAVLAVGYGKDEKTGEDYWLVKNSWGEDWGISGYMKMARNRNNSCGIATMASYPLV
ncbi:hypothetical protein ANN_05830 [Periplaneta americana]|uniref:Cathepsin L n=1 Tax=Periplaneta americana TaxID=6978 RepID=A0ABQ8TBW2_PERAM|nr:hypothetical protein ANN_05830 [Periplaneta americana]